MIRMMALASVLCILSVEPPNLVAQFDAVGNRIGPTFPAGPAELDPFTRRALRERAVAAGGPAAREFVETLGEDAAVALLACSPPVAVKLAEFYASGQLAQLPRPRDLLLLIANSRHGDTVALWAIEHAGELTDPDRFDAYIANPLEYALDLRRLADDAAALRASREHSNAFSTAWERATSWIAALSATDRGMLAFSGVVVGLIGLYAWRRRRQQQGF